jgi:hypothetical protein
MSHHGSIVLASWVARRIRASSGTPHSEYP